MHFSLRFSVLAQPSGIPGAAVPAFAGMLLAGGCAAPLGSQDATANLGPTSCAEPRPQVCTMIYAPVCAEHRDGRRETHASDCNACADDTTLAYVDGPCEEIETP